MHKTLEKMDGAKLFHDPPSIITISSSFIDQNEKRNRLHEALEDIVCRWLGEDGSSVLKIRCCGWTGFKNEQYTFIQTFYCPH